MTIAPKGEGKSGLKRQPLHLADTIIIWEIIFCLIHSSREDNYIALCGCLVGCDAVQAVGK